METRVQLTRRNSEPANADQAVAPARLGAVAFGSAGATADRHDRRGGGRPSMLKPSAIPATPAAGLFVERADSPLEREASAAAGLASRGWHVGVSGSAGSSGSGQRAPAVVDQVLRSPGHSLDAGTRAAFETRFGRNFTNVRVHTDSQAAESAEAVGARAYTAGSHVVFGAGEYSPSSYAGQNLLAHELSHVAQTQPGAAGQSHPVAQPTLMRDPKPGQKKPAEQIPTATSPSDGAKKALEAAKAMQAQTDPALWFDSWGNDLRDNDLNGAVDDRAEQGISDGAHYGKTFNAKICKSPGDQVDKCPASEQSTIKVQYKVCIDVPIEAYKAAGANVSTSRWIPTFFSQMKSKPNWTVWKKPAAPSSLLDGDIVAADNAEHGHAGIVETGMLLNWVINLPGPTSARKYGVFKPSGKNDMVSVPRVLFESILGIDWVARLNK
jgi:hypothetical protein